MWYSILVTAFTNFLLDATGLLRGVNFFNILSKTQIPLSFTLFFHLWSIMIGGNRVMLNLKKYVVLLRFN